MSTNRVSFGDTPSHSSWGAGAVIRSFDSFYFIPPFPNVQASADDWSWGKCFETCRYAGVP